MWILGASKDTALHWIPQTLISCATTLEEGKEGGKEDPEVIAASFDNPPPEHIALADIINIDIPDSEDEEDINIATEPHALITWHTPKVSNLSFADVWVFIVYLASHC
jgi:hypothetical protein